MLGNIVYILCAATSVLCAILLFRGYLRSRAALLLWSAVCFCGLALNNLMLVIDIHMLPGFDLSFWRMIPSILGAGALLIALIWEVR
jgi:hypothetical protein